MGLKSKKKIAPGRAGENMTDLNPFAMKRSLCLLFASLLTASGLRAADDKKKSAEPPASGEASDAAALPRVAAGDIEGVKKLIGKKAVVYGKVTSAKEVEKSGISFLDLDGQKFTVVCWKESYGKFEGGQSPAKLYKGKDIEVTGEIFEYKGKGGKGSAQPEIKLTGPEQIKVISKEKEGGAGAKEEKPEAGKADGKKDDPKKVDPKKYFK